ncbi:hypothetical protein BGY98DRAFT_1014366 [Russula aff. rugulosa BPL654]|nr:hypothetical protein BGY98DRAFT_1014366 [Russula aff. rugulosa BPL654]
MHIASLKAAVSSWACGNSWISQTPPRSSLRYATRCAHLLYATTPLWKRAHRGCPCGGRLCSILRHDPAVTRAAGYKPELEERKDAVGLKAARTAKVNKKFGAALRGYTARAEELGKRLDTASVAIQTAVEYGGVARLRATESGMAPTCVEILERLKEDVLREGMALWSLYGELEKGTIAALEDSESFDSKSSAFRCAH